MKLSPFAVSVASLWSATAKYESVPIAKSGLAADSKLGVSLLAKSRLLEENNGDEDNENQAIDTTWVSGYSLKFLGCHHIRQWNDDAEEAEDVKIETKRLVRFRLCPSTSCSEAKSGGCASGYGDYIIDIDSFVDAYFEASRMASEYQCESYMEANCDCNDDDGHGDDFDYETCEYECFVNTAWADSCINNNDDENNEEQFDVGEYTECSQYEMRENEERKNRYLEEEDKEENENEEEAWYIGPYCAEQGGAIHLGFFTDNECTSFADSQGGSSTFESMTGFKLPYSATNIIGSECVSCLDRQDGADDNGGDEDYDNTLEMCEEIYSAAGKCESNLPSGTVDEPNENACNYIAGVRLVRHNGIVARAASKKSNGVATFFIFLFAFIFGTLIFYVHFLRTKLGLKENSLL